MTLREGSDSEDVPNNDCNLAMADAMRKVLNLGKHSDKATLVLAKAKILDSKSVAKETTKNGVEAKGEDQKNDESREVADADDVKPVVIKLKKKRTQKREVIALGRLKPNVLDRVKEKPLMKIATRGVVQLFNVIKDQQNIISKKIEEAGPSETKKEKVLKSLDKQSFLDVLLGHASQGTAPAEIKIEKDENEVEEKEEQSWSVLRDDFMMGAKLKDWDKSQPTSPPVKRKKQKAKD